MKIVKIIVFLFSFFFLDYPLIANHSVAPWVSAVVRHARILARQRELPLSQVSRFASLSFQLEDSKVQRLTDPRIPWIQDFERHSRKSLIQNDRWLSEGHLTFLPQVRINIYSPKFGVSPREKTFSFPSFFSPPYPATFSFSPIPPELASLPITLVSGGNEEIPFLLRSEKLATHVVILENELSGWLFASSKLNAKDVKVYLFSKLGLSSALKIFQKTQNYSNQIFRCLVFGLSPYRVQFLQNWGKDLMQEDRILIGRFPNGFFDSIYSEPFPSPWKDSKLVRVKKRKWFCLPWPEGESLSYDLSALLCELKNPILIVDTADNLDEVMEISACFPFSGKPIKFGKGRKIVYDPIWNGDPRIDLLHDRPSNLASLIGNLLDLGNFHEKFRFFLIPNEPKKLTEFLGSIKKTERKF